MTGNGAVPDDHGQSAPTSIGGDVLNESEQIAALELGYEFPGYVPVVVVAHRTEVFETMLAARLADVQGADPYRRTDRLSRDGNYAAYRIEIFVPNAREAVARRAAIAALPGVKLML